MVPYREISGEAPRTAGRARVRSEPQNPCGYWYFFRRDNRPAVTKPPATDQLHSSRYAEHVYFYAATAASPETIRHYLDQAYDLGKTFERDTRTAPARPAEHTTDGTTGAIA